MPISHHHTTGIVRRMLLLCRNGVIMQGSAERSAPVVAAGLLRRLPQVLQHVPVVALEFADARNACSAIVRVPPQC